MMKRGTALLLCAVLALSCFGCMPVRPEAAEPSGRAASMASNKDRLIIDGAGRSVAVPQEVERVMGYATPLLVDLGRDDLIVALSAEKSPSIYDYIAPTFQSIGYRPSGTHDDSNTIETIAGLAPDLYFCRARSVSAMQEGLESLNIPMVVFAHETPEETFAALRLVAACIGEPERAEHVVGLYEERLKSIRDITGKAVRPTGVILGGQPGKVANGGMLQSIMMEAAGVINAARDVDSDGGIWPDVGVETVFSWDPDYIFVTTWGNAAYTADDLLNDPSWQALRAVREGHVFALPCALDKWEYPDACSVLLAGWMASVAHPDLYPDERMEADTLAYYKAVYGPACDALSRDILGF